MSNFENANVACDTKKIKSFVSCVEEAVGNDIKNDMHGLATGNSKADRIWDILHTNLRSNMNTLDCIVDVTKRGRWEMMPVFDKESGFLYNFMRESRFEDLKRERRRGREQGHYVNCLAHILNADLIGVEGQQQLDTSYCSVQKVSLISMKKAVDKILNDLRISENTVKHHVLILFTSRNYVLETIRAVMIDREMNIAHESIWNKYINPVESIIMDTTSSSNNASDNPSRGLKLSNEALKRKKSNVGRKITPKRDTKIEE